MEQGLETNELIEGEIYKCRLSGLKVLVTLVDEENDTAIGQIFQNEQFRTITIHYKQLTKWT